MIICGVDVQYFLACYEEKIKKSTDMLAAPTSLIGVTDHFLFYLYSMYSSRCLESE